MFIEEEMPDGLSLETICTVQKKNYEAMYENYRGITLLSVVTKIFAKLLAR